MEIDSPLLVCELCGGVFPTERMENHLLHWCPSLESGSDDEIVVANIPQPPQVPIASAGSMTKGWLHSVVDIEFSSVPIVLKFEQQSVFGDSGTGGGVWHSELVLAEKCVRDFGTRTVNFSKPPRVLELGCGVAPAASLVCLALGCDVLMTDMRPLLRHIEANIRLNHEAITSVRRLYSDDVDGALSRTACDTEALLFGVPLPTRVQTMGPFDLVMCSDCVFRTELHDPLGYTLRALLLQNRDCRDSEGRCNSDRSVEPSCLVSFFKREQHYMDFIDKTCPHFGLKASRCLDVKSLYDEVAWCTHADSISLDSNYFMYDISLLSDRSFTLTK